MTHIPKGQLIADGEYCKHLRKWGGRYFWHRHRLAERREIDRLHRENLSTRELEDSGGK